MSSEAKQTALSAGGNKLLKQLLALVFGVVLLWLAFRGTTFDAVWAYAKKVDPFYLLLLSLSGLTSHILRAWRWTYLLKPLSDKKVSLWNAFCAIIFGYAVNIAIPRGGEIFRLVYFSNSEKLPVAGVLPTMFIDRLLDLAMLGILVGLTLNFLPPKLLQDYPALVPGGILMAVASLIGLFALPKMSAILNWLLKNPKLTEKLSEKLVEKIEALAEQFETGTKSLSDPSAYPVIAISTILIWTLYWFNNWSLVLGFHLQDKISPMQALVVFTIGTIGVLVPTPGSAGSFHMLVKLGLMYTCGLDENLALSYAIVLHLFSFIIVIIVPALFCWLWRLLKPASGS
jgi:glycosyltransferase 2 family protein